MGASKTGRSAWIAGLLMAAALGLWTAEARAGALRKWTDAQGNTRTASFVRVHKGDVVLLRGSGAIRVPFSNLSPQDQEYVRQELAKKGQADLVPPSAGGTTVVAPVPADKTPAASARSSRNGRPKALRPVGGAEDAASEESPGIEPSRGWSDKVGNTIQAQFVGVTGSQVLLRRNGKQVAYPFSGFSISDQEYLRTRLTARGEGHLIAGLTGGATPGTMGSSAAPAYAASSAPSGSSSPYGSGGSGSSPSPDSYGSASYGSSSPSESYGSAGSSSPPSESSGSSSGSYASSSSPDESVGSGSSPPNEVASAPPTESFQPPVMPSYSPPTGPQMQYTQAWMCTKCNKELPGSIKAGDECPNCGAFLAYEDDGSGNRKYASSFRSYRSMFKLIVWGCIFVGSLIAGIARKMNS